MDFSRFSDVNAWESAGVAAALWIWFMLVCPWQARRQGVAHEEPPIWLYGATFKTLRALTLFIAVGIGLFLPVTQDLAALATDRAISLGLAAVYDAIIVAILVGILWLMRRRRAQREAVVLEPLTAGGVFLRALAVLAILGALVGVPWIANSYMETNLLTPLFGGANAPGGYHADLAAFFGFALTFVLFWTLPAVMADRLEERDAEPVWAQSSGLAFFRCGWSGVVLFAAIGVFAGIPGLNAVFPYPMPLVAGFVLPLIGALIYSLFWVWPMRSMAVKADGGDYLANEMASEVRFSGVVALMRYSQEVRRRPKGDGETKLCATCLRPVNDIALYKDFKFDHCPHCGSFIPPVFNVIDFVRAQSDRIMPLLEDEGPPGPGKKKKRERTVDEGRLVQDLLRALLAMAVQERGTDLHMIIEKDKLAARCRTDGVLYTMIEFDQAMSRPLISAAKVLASLDITERRKPQDGSFKVDLGDRKVDVRINTSPVPSGEMAAMRLLYLQDVLGSVEKLGMSPRNLKTVSRLIHNPTGLILVTGPTGSGKSTTLYNALQSLASGERNIVTLEDPIEHQISGLTQMQVNPSKGFTFATGLRTILRQDPDVIMVGEVRDGETAKMAVDAAATGHLVFTTLHSNDSVGVLGRLTDLGIESGRLGEVLVLSMAQRLIRRNCPKCSQEEMVSRETLEERGIPGLPQEIVQLVRGSGCGNCHETGYFGREGIYELLVPNEELKSLIAKGTGAIDLRRRARSLGMRTLLEDGLVKVLLGRTTVDELVRVTS